MGSICSKSSPAVRDERRHVVGDPMANNRQRNALQQSQRPVLPIIDQQEPEPKLHHRQSSKRQEHVAAVASPRSSSEEVRDESDIDESTAQSRILEVIEQEETRLEVEKAAHSLFWDPLNQSVGRISAAPRKVPKATAAPATTKASNSSRSIQSKSSSHQRQSTNHPMPSRSNSKLKEQADVATTGNSAVDPAAHVVVVDDPRQLPTTVKSGGDDYSRPETPTSVSNGQPLPPVSQRSSWQPTNRNLKTKSSSMAAMPPPDGLTGGEASVLLEDGGANTLPGRVQTGDDTDNQVAQLLGKPLGARTPQHGEDSSSDVDELMQRTGDRSQRPLIPNKNTHHDAKYVENKNAGFRNGGGDRRFDVASNSASASPPLLPSHQSPTTAFGNVLKGPQPRHREVSATHEEEEVGEVDNMSFSSANSHHQSEMSIFPITEGGVGSLVGMRTPQDGASTTNNSFSPDPRRRHSATMEPSVAGAAISSSSSGTQLTKTRDVLSTTTVTNTMHPSHIHSTGVTAQRDDGGGVTFVNPLLAPTAQTFVISQSRVHPELRKLLAAASDTVKCCAEGDLVGLANLVNTHGKGVATLRKRALVPTMVTMYLRCIAAPQVAVVATPERDEAERPLGHTPNNDTLIRKASQSLVTSETRLESALRGDNASSSLLHVDDLSASDLESIATGATASTSPSNHGDSSDSDDEVKKTPTKQNSQLVSASHSRQVMAETGPQSHVHHALRALASSQSRLARNHSNLTQPTGPRGVAGAAGSEVKGSGAGTTVNDSESVLRTFSSHHGGGGRGWVGEGSWVFTTATPSHIDNPTNGSGRNAPPHQQQGWLDAEIHQRLVYHAQLVTDCLNGAPPVFTNIHSATATSEWQLTCRKRWCALSGVAALDDDAVPEVLLPGDAPFHAAARGGNTDAISYLVRQIGTKRSSISGWQLKGTEEQDGSSRVGSPSFAAMSNNEVSPILLSLRSQQQSPTLLGGRDALSPTPSALHLASGMPPRAPSDALSTHARPFSGRLSAAGFREDAAHERPRSEVSYDGSLDPPAGGAANVASTGVASNLVGFLLEAVRASTQPLDAERKRATITIGGSEVTSLNSTDRFDSVASYQKHQALGPNNNTNQPLPSLPPSTTHSEATSPHREDAPLGGRFSAQRLGDQPVLKLSNDSSNSAMGETNPHRRPGSEMSVGSRPHSPQIPFLPASSIPRASTAMFAQNGVASSSKVGINEIHLGQAALHAAVASGRPKVVYELISKCGAATSYPGNLVVPLRQLRTEVLDFCQERLSELDDALYAEEIRLQRLMGGSEDRENEDTARHISEIERTVTELERQRDYWVEIQGCVVGGEPPCDGDEEEILERDPNQKHNTNNKCNWRGTLCPLPTLLSGMSIVAPAGDPTTSSPYTNHGSSGIHEDEGDQSYAFSNKVGNKHVRGGGGDGSSRAPFRGGGDKRGEREMGISRQLQMLRTALISPCAIVVGSTAPSVSTLHKLSYTSTSVGSPPPPRFPVTAPTAAVLPPSRHCFATPFITLVAATTLASPGSNLDGPSGPILVSKGPMSSSSLRQRVVSFPQIYRICESCRVADGGKSVLDVKQLNYALPAAATTPGGATNHHHNQASPSKAPLRTQSILAAAASGGHAGNAALARNKGVVGGVETNNSTHSGSLASHYTELTGGGTEPLSNEAHRLFGLFGGGGGAHLYPTDGSPSSMANDDEQLVPVFCPFCCVEEQPLHTAVASGNAAIVMLLLETVVTAVCNVFGNTSNGNHRGSSASSKSRGSVETSAALGAAAAAARRPGSGVGSGGSLAAAQFTEAMAEAGCSTPLQRLRFLQQNRRRAALRTGQSTEGALPEGYLKLIGLTQDGLRVVAAFVNMKRFRDGFTALHVAAASGNHAIVKMLLEHNADPFLRASPVSIDFAALQLAGNAASDRDERHAILRNFKGITPIEAANSAVASFLKLQGAAIRMHGGNGNGNPLNSTLCDAAVGKGKKATLAMQALILGGPMLHLAQYSRLESASGTSHPSTQRQPQHSIAATNLAELFQLNKTRMEKERQGSVRGDTRSSRPGSSSGMTTNTDNALNHLSGNARRSLESSTSITGVAPPVQPPQHTGAFRQSSFARHQQQAATTPSLPTASGRTSQSSISAPNGERIKSGSIVTPSPLLLRAPEGLPPLRR